MFSTYSQFLEIITDECKDFTEEESDKYIYFPQSIAEIFELDFPFFIDPFFNRVFSEVYIKITFFIKKLVI